MFASFIRKIFSRYAPFDYVFLAMLFTIASYQLWQLEEVTMTGLGAAVLKTLLILVAYGVALYALLWSIRRIALAYGVHLGSWGSDTALDAFIKVRRNKLTRSGGGRPLAQGRSQSLLGLALGERGARGPDAGALRQSADAFRQALPALHAAGKDEEASLTQSNLAVTLLHLSRQEIERRSLEEAVEALRSAAAALEKAGNTPDWVEVQFLLSAALRDLGRLEDGTERLAEAVAAGRAALAAEDNTEVPMADARLQINLAQALATLGEREAGTERLEEAVAMARDSLRVIAEDKDDILNVEESRAWRRLQLGNLGSALRCLGERRNDSGLLREAVDSLRQAAALETKGKDYDWALVQNELACALSSLGVQADSLSASDAALAVLTREDYPVDWAIALSARARTLAFPAVGDPDPAALRRARDDLEAALAVFMQADAPVQCRDCRQALDRVTARLDESTGRGTKD